MGDWVTALSSIGAFITAVAALWAIREMRHQRTSMYLPDIVAARSNFYVYTDPSLPFGLPLVLVSNRLRSDEQRESPLSVSVNCFNIGLGSAKRLRAKWRFDVQDFIFKIGEADPDRTFPIWNDDFEISLPAGERQTLSIFKHQVEREEPYLLPAQSGAGAFQLILPFAYVHLYTVSLLLSIRKQRSGEERGWVFPPPLYLELSYTDVGGKLHSRSFTIAPEPMYTVERPDAERPTLSGEGEFVVRPTASS